MMTPFVRNIAFLVCFLCGWIASNWQSDSVQLVALKAAQIASQGVAADQLKSAEKIQAELSRLSVNEKVIIKENVKLVDRPVYHNVCLDTDGLFNANAAKNGTPGRVIERVPGG